MYSSWDMVHWCTTYGQVDGQVEKVTYRGGFSTQIGNRMSDIYYWEKLTFSKLVGKVNLSERKFEEMHQLWRTKRCKVIQGCLFWDYCLQLSFVYKTISEISFNLFCSGDKKLLSEFLNKWGWFLGHNECFPKYLG